jgi:Tfp pilus assembly protein PilF
MPTSLPEAANVKILIVAFSALSLVALGCAHRSTSPLHPRAVELQANGTTALQRGDLDRAAGQFSLALEYEPRMAEAENGLGLVALRYHDRPGASQHFRAALALDEDLAEAHLNLGGMLLADGETKDALVHFRAALSIDPGYGAARLATAEALLRLGRLADARWELAKLCASDPANAAAHADHALVLVRLDRIAAAETAVERALEIDRNLPAAHRARAEILRRRGDLAGAETEWRIVLAAGGASSGSVEDRLSLGTVLAELARWDDAAAVLGGAALAGPRHAQVHFALAYVELSRDRPTAAIVAARKALELRPSYPEARLVLAEALLRGGDWNEGRQELRRFVDEAPPEMSAEKSRASDFLGTRQQLSLPAAGN